MYIAADCCLQRDRVDVILSVLLYSILSVQIVCSVQLNCTYSNYTEAAATCSAAQQHSTFTVQILYKLYSLQQNCTYSNYTKAAAICSAAQQERVQLLSSAVQCGRLFDAVCVYRQSYPEIRSFKEIHMTTITLPHTVTALRNARLISSHATARRLSWQTDPLEWDDVIDKRGVIGHDVPRSSSTHINTSCMTQRTTRMRLSLPSTAQHTQPLSHTI
jgi:hypothetical protein